MKHFSYNPYPSANAAFESIQQLHDRRSRDEPFPISAIGSIIEFIDAIGFLHSQGYSYKRLAEILALPYSQVRHWGLMAHRLTEAAKDYLHTSSNIQMGHARVIARFPDSEQLAIAKRTEMYGYSVARLEKEWRNFGDATESEMDEYMTRLAEHMGEHVGAPIRILVDPKNNRAGQILIPYSSLDEFDGICERFGFNASDYL